MGKRVLQYFKKVETAHHIVARSWNRRRVDRALTDLQQLLSHVDDRLRHLNLNELQVSETHSNRELDLEGLEDVHNCVLSRFQQIDY